MLPETGTPTARAQPGENRHAARLDNSRPTPGITATEQAGHGAAQTGMNTRQSKLAGQSGAARYVTFINVNPCSVLRVSYPIFRHDMMKPSAGGPAPV